MSATQCILLVSMAMASRCALARAAREVEGIQHGPTSSHAYHWLPNAIRGFQRGRILRAQVSMELVSPHLIIRQGIPANDTLSSAACIRHFVMQPEFHADDTLLNITCMSCGGG
eukprot:jgi/Ulvmu1/11945/UM082_0024.1